MKIGPARFLGDPIHLPVEIIETIADHVAYLADEHVSQYTLWSLCQLSRDWYGASIKHLYSSPVLGTRNFDLFARTICPPLNTRTRAAGLENLITKLRLGHLAYTTSSSMTARLLRRTKKSLVLFESPSHSMSTSCLAPISKLTSLQHLDLSRDMYDFGIDALMRAIHPLSQLRYLSLPRFALVVPPSSSYATPSWPPALEYLESNYGTPASLDEWRKFMEPLPNSLRTLSFQQLRPGELNVDFQNSGIRTPQITTLLLVVQENDYAWVDELNLYGVLCTFPRLIQLTLPDSLFDSDNSFITPVQGLGRDLQTLTIGHGSEDITLREHRRHLHPSFLEMLHALERLQCLIIDSAFKNENRDLLAACDTFLSKRWPDASRDSKGVLVQEAEQLRRWDTLKDAQRPPTPPPPTAWFPSTPRSAVISE